MNRETTDVTAFASSTTDQDIVCVEAKHSPTTVDHAGVISVYHYGIFYASSPARTWTSADYRKAAVATCYSLALAHHLHGLSDANHSPSLDKALKAYELARSLLASLVGGQDIRTVPQDVKLLALAIANNEGHVLWVQYKSTAARERWLEFHSLVPYTFVTAQTLPFFASAAAYPSEDGIPALPAPAA
jgi:hypothetical protein